MTAYLLAAFFVAMPVIAATVAYRHAKRPAQQTEQADPRIVVNPLPRVSQKPLGILRKRPRVSVRKL